MNPEGLFWRICKKLMEDLKYMVILPDGDMIEMRWKSVSYIFGEKKIVFSIIPMMNSADYIMVSNAEQWTKYLSIEKRNEIIVILEKVNWKRDINIVELDIPPYITNKKEDIITPGSLESTEAGRKMEQDFLFDPASPLSKDQVKEIYCTLEKRFAENAVGDVKIPKASIIAGSVLDAISIPALEKNAKVNLYVY